MQKEKEMQKEKQKGYAPSFVASPPEVVVDSDSTLPPSQNKRRMVHRTVDDTEQLVVVQELPTTDAATQNICVNQVTGPSVGVATASGKLSATQAAAYVIQAAPSFSSTMADPGLSQVVYTELTQVKQPVHIP